MLNIIFLACAKVELWDLTVGIVVYQYQSDTMALALVRQCPVLNLPQLFSYTKTFIFLDPFLFELSCKNTHRNTHTHTQMHTKTWTHTKTLMSTL